MATTSAVKKKLVRAWLERHAPNLSQGAILAAKEHLTYEEAIIKGMLEETDSQQKYIAAREGHIEVTLAYIKGKPGSLMKR
ncbi:MAG: hypothetical protein FWB98_09295 [Defluviitaleaceae bacterium]|nr:hypothetical protein [Defluviitaleaceae bacterium]